MYPLRGNNSYVQQQPQQPYSSQSAYGQYLGPEVVASQMPMPSRHAAMLSGHPSSGPQYGGQYASVHGSMASTSVPQVPGPKDELSSYPSGDRRQYVERPGVYSVPDSQSQPTARLADSVPFGHHQHQADMHARLDVASGLRKELPHALTLQSASIEGSSRMNPSSGNIAYGQQPQQPYSGQSAYGQNLGPDGGVMPSRNAAILSGHPSSAARYGGLQVPGASGKVPGPFGSEGQNGYSSTMQESPKYASGDYFERPSVYTVLDPQNKPTAVFADSVAYDHHYQMENNTNTSPLSLRSILEKDKLNGNNFLDWYGNLRIVLKHERKLYVLDARVPHRPDENATRAVKIAYEKHFTDSIDVGCLMLNTMSLELQKDLERLQPYEMIVTLRKMFQHETRQKRFEITKAMRSCKMAEGASISSHFMKMKGYFEHLVRLGFPVPQDLAIDFILSSLPKSYDEFVKNYTMNNMDESFSELHSMLKTVEKSIGSKPNHVLMVRKEKVIKMHGKPNHVLMVRKGKVTKIPGKGKKIVGKPKPKPQPEPKPKVEVKGKTPKEEATCFHCNEVGHWKRNCKLYLEDLKKNKAKETDSEDLKKNKAKETDT